MGKSNWKRPQPYFGEGHVMNVIGAAYKLGQCAAVVAQKIAESAAVASATNLVGERNDTTVLVSFVGEAWAPWC